MKTQRHRYELFGLLACAVTAGGCVYTLSGESQQSTDPVKFQGATEQYWEHVDLYLRDRRGAEVGVPPAETWIDEASTASSPSASGLYQLSVTIPASKLPASAWIPQVPDGRAPGRGGLARSVGRLEIVARPRALPGREAKPNLRTFSRAALPCLGTAAGRANPLSCSDGDSFLVYDNDGVGVRGRARGFTEIAGSPFALSGLAAGVDLEIGTYGVPGLDPSVNAVVCRPHGAAPRNGFRTVVLNHGEFKLDFGALDACVSWARAGWLAALSAYRFEPITAVVPATNPPILRLPYTYPVEIERPGTTDLPELCLGEVTDVLRWLDIVRARSDTDDAQILMWGYSHGACVTLRSLEQGAKVKAAVAVAPPTEFFTWNPTLPIPPEGFQARSSARMAVDLERRGDVRLLQIAVERDTIVHPSQGCLMAKVIGAENHQMIAGGEYSTNTGDPLGINFAGCVNLPWTAAPVNWNQRAVFLLYPNISWIPIPPFFINGHAFFGYSTPPPVGGAWDIPYNKAIRDFLQASFP